MVASTKGVCYFGVNLDQSLDGNYSAAIVGLYGDICNAILQNKTIRFVLNCSQESILVLTNSKLDTCLGTCLK